MSRIDDLSKGDFVCIVEDTLARGMSEPFVFDIDYSGEPFEVISFGLPFILLRSPKGVKQTVDVRRYRVQKVPQDYFVQHLTGEYETVTRKKLLSVQNSGKEKDAIKDQNCPHCGEVLQEIIVNSLTKQGRKYVCKCGFVGILVTKK